MDGSPSVQTVKIASGRDYAGDLFDQVLQVGRIRRIKAFFSHRPVRLLDLADLKLRLINSVYAGRHEVALDDIRGTVGRQNDFDDNFNPLSERTFQRWLSIFEAYRRGIVLPPVELIQVGSIYFVRDGHHRISVARAMGLTTISAVVTIWNVSIQ